MSTTWVCKDCGSKDIEEAVWAKVNTSEILNIYGGESEYWCPKCQSHDITVIYYCNRSRNL